MAPTISELIKIIDFKLADFSKLDEIKEIFSSKGEEEAYGEFRNYQESSNLVGSLWMYVTKPENEEFYRSLMSILLKKKDYENYVKIIDPSIVIEAITPIVKKLYQRDDKEGLQKIHKGLMYHSKGDFNFKEF